MAIADRLRRTCRAGALLGAATLLGAAVASGPAGAETATPPPGTARIWVYRTYDPQTSLDVAYVRINSAFVDAAPLGSAFYRDVPPGDYRITTDSRGTVEGQFARVALAAGETVFVKVDANNWAAGACCQCGIVTFYTLVVSPPLAEADMASLPRRGGG